MSEQTIDWRRISQQLREPFDPADVDFRVQGKVNEQTGKGQVVAYIDARAVQDRLDAVVDAGAWSFDWQPLNLDAKGEVTTAKGVLTIHGVSKADVGTASNFEPTKGCVSDCFKRTAAQWGIGRYLYDIPSAYVAVEKGGRIPDATLRELRSRLGKRHNSAPTPEPEAQPAPPPAQRHAQAAQPQQHDGNEPANAKQLQAIAQLSQQLGQQVPEVRGYGHAKAIITQLNGELQARRQQAS